MGTPFLRYVTTWFCTDPQHIAGLKWRVRPVDAALTHLGDPVGLERERVADPDLRVGIVRVQADETQGGRLGCRELHVAVRGDPLDRRRAGVLTAVAAPRLPERAAAGRRVDERGPPDGLHDAGAAPARRGIRH